MVDRAGCVDSGRDGIACSWLSLAWWGPEREGFRQWCEGWDGDAVARTHPELLELDKRREFLSRRVRDLVVPDVERRELSLQVHISLRSVSVCHRAERERASTPTHQVAQALDAGQAVVRQVQFLELGERVEPLDLGQTVAWSRIERSVSLSAGAWEGRGTGGAHSGC